MPVWIYLTPKLRIGPRPVALSWVGLPLAGLRHNQLSTEKLAYAATDRPSNGALNLLIDSTGIKFFGEGEWEPKKHRVASRRQWCIRYQGLSCSRRLTTGACGKKYTDSSASNKLLPKPAAKPC